MVTRWEQDIYDEILQGYDRVCGLDMNLDPFAYMQINKLMLMMKNEYKYDKEKLREVITNAIVLIISLFFQKDDDDDTGGGRALTKEEQDQMKAILSDAFNMAINPTEA